MKKILSLAVIAIALVFTAACKGPKETTSIDNTSSTSVADQDSLFATYERTACFGKCPILTMTIYKSGYTIFEGVKWTKAVGKFTGYVPQKDLKELIEIADGIEYWIMEDDYDRKEVSDLPATIFYLNKNGTKKRVRNRYQGPKSLQKLQERFDLIIANADWIVPAANDR